MKEGIYNMKTQISILAGILSMATALQADLLVTVTGADGDSPGAASLGTSAVTSPVVDGASGQSLIYQISGLTIDGTGSGDDTVDLTFSVTTDGQAVNHTGGDLSSGGVWMNGIGEYAQVAFNSISVNLSGGSGNGFGSFVGFTELTATSFDAGDVVEVNGVTQNFDGGASSPFAIPNASFVKLEQTIVADTVRVNNWDFQFNASVIPEPSVLGLLGLGAGVLYSARRKNSRV